MPNTRSHCTHKTAKQKLHEEQHELLQITEQQVLPVCRQTFPMMHKPEVLCVTLNFHKPFDNFLKQ